MTTEEAEEEIIFHEIAQELISAISFNAGSISVAQEEKFEKIYELIKKSSYYNYDRSWKVWIYCSVYCSTSFPCVANSWKGLLY